MPYLAIDQTGPPRWVLVSIWDNGNKSRIEPAPDAVSALSKRDPAYVIRLASNPPNKTERLVHIFRHSRTSRSNRRSYSFPPVTLALYHTLAGHTAQLSERWPSLSPEERAFCLLELIDHQTDGVLTSSISKRLNRAHKALSLALSTPYPGERQTAFSIALSVLSDCADFNDQQQSEEKQA